MKLGYGEDASSVKRFDPPKKARTRRGRPGGPAIGKMGGGRGTPKVATPSSRPKGPKSGAHNVVPGTRRAKMSGITAPRGDKGPRPNASVKPQLPGSRTGASPRPKPVAPGGTTAPGGKPTGGRKSMGSVAPTASTRRGIRPPKPKA